MTAKRIEIPAAKAAAGGAPYEERQLQQTQKAVKSPPPPAAYGGLRLGPELSIELEAVQALPVSMEQSLLRNLSPFMVQVEPPMVPQRSPSPDTGERVNLGPNKGSLVHSPQKLRQVTSETP